METKLENKKMILLTGASGFLGYSCAQTLQAKQNYHVRFAVRKSYMPRQENNIDLVVTDDLSATTQWQRALQNCDCVIHTAGRAHIIKETASNPLSEYRRINVAGTENLARSAVEAGVRRFIYISSIKVNGEINSLGNPFTADDSPQPSDPYSCSKFEAEEALKKIAQQSEMEVVIIRPPLIYGKGVKGNFKTILTWVAKGLPIPVTSVNNKRSFVGLDNLIDLIETCIVHPKACNQTFLVSDGYDLSTVELIRAISTLMDKKARLLFIPWLPTIFKLLGKKGMLDRLYGSLQADISKNYEVLGWKPKFKFADMLQQTVNDFLTRSTITHSLQESAANPTKKTTCSGKPTTYLDLAHSTRDVGTHTINDVEEI